MFYGLQMNHIIARHCKLEYLALAKCSGYHPPALSDRQEGPKIMLPEISHRSAHCVVARMQFYGVQGGRHDSMMIASNEGFDHRNAERFITLWFGKAILFVRIFLHPTSSTPPLIELMTEFCFVQYYNVIGVK